MKFKLDENLGHRALGLMLSRSLDTHSVHDEALSGSDDDTVYAACKSESRCLITLDLDFAEITRFPPAESPGVIVLRQPRRATQEYLLQLLDSVLDAVGDQDLHGQLWVVEQGRIRIRQSTELTE